MSNSNQNETPTPSLDHLVLFLPANPTTNLPSTPPFINDNFTLTPGGFHADGASSNVLIILSDGCYIELISFINRDAAKTHWWGPDATFVGWKDWCLTTSSAPEENYERVKMTHAEPVRGGRKRQDGEDVRWAVTFPGGENGGQEKRGRVPFFCHDVTPRGMRVPAEEEKTAHLSGVLGVKEFTVVVRDQRLLDETRGVYTSILGEEVRSSGDTVEFDVGRIHGVEGLGGDGAKIVLRLPKDEEEAKQTQRTGYVFGNVVLGAKASVGKPSGMKERIDDPGEGMSVGGLWIEYL